MAQSQAPDELWEEFHRVVNMSSPDLRSWLMQRGAGQETEELPDRAGPALGRRVLAVLGKRRTDLTQDDVLVMRRVVDRVHDLRGDEPEPTAGKPEWRHRLMDVGHDRKSVV